MQTINWEVSHPQERSCSVVGWYGTKPKAKTVKDIGFIDSLVLSKLSSIGNICFEEKFQCRQMLRSSKRLGQEDFFISWRYCVPFSFYFFSFLVNISRLWTGKKKRFPVLFCGYQQLPVTLKVECYLVCYRTWEHVNRSTHLKCQWQLSPVHLFLSALLQDVHFSDDLQEPKKCKLTSTEPTNVLLPQILNKKKTKAALHWVRGQNKVVWKGSTTLSRGDTWALWIHFAVQIYAILNYDRNHL